MLARMRHVSPCHDAAADAASDTLIALRVASLFSPDSAAYVDDDADADAELLMPRHAADI